MAAAGGQLRKGFPALVVAGIGVAREVGEGPDPGGAEHVGRGSRYVTSERILDVGGNPGQRVAGVEIVGHVEVHGLESMEPSFDAVLCRVEVVVRRLVERLKESGAHEHESSGLGYSRE